MAEGNNNEIAYKELPVWVMNWLLFCIQSAIKSYSGWSILSYVTHEINTKPNKVSITVVSPAQLLLFKLCDHTARLIMFLMCLCVLTAYMGQRIEATDLSVWGEKEKPYMLVDCGKPIRVGNSINCSFAFMDCGNVSKLSVTQERWCGIKTCSVRNVHMKVSEAQLSISGTLVQIFSETSSGATPPT